MDDYLTKEEQCNKQRERSRRLLEKKDLRAAGTTVAWRKATLWKLIKEGEKDMWRLVPAPTAAGGAAAGGAATEGAATAAGGAAEAAGAST